MPRYVALALGLVYADSVLPNTTSSVIEVCRLGDAAVGETGMTYALVGRGDISADYEVYVARADLPADQPPDLDTDLTYVASVTSTGGTQAGQLLPTTAAPLKANFRRFPLASASGPPQTQQERDAAEAARPALVTYSLLPSLYSALETLSVADGGEPGVGGYVLPRSARTALPTVDAALSQLPPADFTALVSGTPAERSAVAGRSPALTQASQILDNFAGR